MNNSNPSNTLPSSNTPVFQRRTKTEMACNECRRSKLKCDQTIPRTTCKRCKEKNVKCEYVVGASSTPGASSSANNTPVSQNHYNPNEVFANPRPISLPIVPNGTGYVEEPSDVMMPSSVNQAEQVSAQVDQAGHLNMDSQPCYCSTNDPCAFHANLNDLAQFMEILAYENSRNGMPQTPTD